MKFRYIVYQNVRFRFYDKIVLNFMHSNIVYKVKMSRLFHLDTTSFQKFQFFYFTFYWVQSHEIRKEKYIHFMHLSIKFSTFLIRFLSQLYYITKKLFNFIGQARCASRRTFKQYLLQNKSSLSICIACIDRIYPQRIQANNIQYLSSLKL